MCACVCERERDRQTDVPSFVSGFEFLMNAENLAKISMPAVFDSGCLAPSLMYLHTSTHTSNIHVNKYEEFKKDTSVDILLFLRPMV